MFSEKQRMKLPVLWSFLIAIGLILAYGTYLQINHKIPLGNNPVTDILLLSLTIVYFIGLIFSSRIHLSVRITKEGIEFRFFPFHIKYRLIPFSDIKIAEIRNYSPIEEFGGWGIRRADKKLAYTISGKHCIEFHLKSRKTILLGTQNQDVFAKALRSAGAVISKTNFEH